MQKKVVLAAQLLLFVFCGIGFYLLICNLMLKKSLGKISKEVVIAKDKDSYQHMKLKQDLRRDMEEKYRADMISYQVVTKRLEQEKNRQQDLKQKLTKSGKKTKQ